MCGEESSVNFVACVVLVVSIPFLTTPLSELGGGGDSGEEPEPVAEFLLAQAFAVRVHEGVDANATMRSLETFIDGSDVKLELISFKDDELVVGILSKQSGQTQLTNYLIDSIEGGDPTISSIGISSIVVEDVEYIVCPLGFYGSDCSLCLSTPEGGICRSLLATTVLPTTLPPTSPPTPSPTEETDPPTQTPTTEEPTIIVVTTREPTTPDPTTAEPTTPLTTPEPTTVSTTAAPSSEAPTTEVPTSQVTTTTALVQTEPPSTQPPLPELDLGSEILNATGNTLEGRVFARPTNAGDRLNGRFEFSFRLRSGSVINSISMTPVLGPVELEPNDEYLIVKIGQNLVDSSDGITVLFTAHTDFDASTSTIDQVQLIPISSSTS